MESLIANVDIFDIQNRPLKMPLKPARNHENNIAQKYSPTSLKCGRYRTRLPRGLNRVRMSVACRSVKSQPLQIARLLILAGAVRLGRRPPMRN